MAKVMGIGGVFLKCADVEVTKAWYQKVLGLTVTDYGGFDFEQGPAVEAFGPGARTIFAPFAADSDYFSPSEQPFMINLMVDDLDAILLQIEAQNVKQLQPAESYSYGKFAWVLDPDGRKLELWQPLSTDKD